MACICWLYLLSTYHGCGILFNALALFGYALWWLFVFDLASFFGVMSVPWKQMQYYDYFKYRLHIWLWIIFLILDLMIGYMWTKLSECLFRFCLWEYAMHLDAI